MENITYVCTEQKFLIAIYAIAESCLDLLFGARGWNISVLNLIGVEQKSVINTAVVGRELDP